MKVVKGTIANRGNGKSNLEIYDYESQLEEALAEKYKIEYYEVVSLGIFSKVIDESIEEYKLEKSLGISMDES